MRGESARARGQIHGQFTSVSKKETNRFTTRRAMEMKNSFRRARETERRGNFLRTIRQASQRIRVRRISLRNGKLTRASRHSRLGTQIGLPSAEKQHTIRPDVSKCLCQTRATSVDGYTQLTNHRAASIAPLRLAASFGISLAYVFCLIAPTFRDPEHHGYFQRAVHFTAPTCTLS